MFADEQKPDESIVKAVTSTYESFSKSWENEISSEKIFWVDVWAVIFWPCKNFKYFKAGG